jgi:hypothetical protein
MYAVEYILPGLGRNFLTRAMLDARSTKEALTLLATADQVRRPAVSLFKDGTTAHSRKAEGTQGRVTQSVTLTPALA